jgi:hypothetical protein
MLCLNMPNTNNLGQTLPVWTSTGHWSVLNRIVPAPPPPDHNPAGVVAVENPAVHDWGVYRLTL